MFGTLQDRLVELEHAGITDIETATWIREVYLPQHNARFAKPAALPEKAFVAADLISCERPCAARRSASSPTTRWRMAG